MNERSYTPRVNPRPALALVGADLLVTLLLLIASAAVPYGRGVLELGVLAFAAAGIFLAVKYLLTTYTYTITDRYGAWMLIVSQTVGKRSSTVARVPLADVSDVKPQKEMTVRARRYDYSAGIGKKGKYLLAACTDGVPFGILFSPDDEFLSELENARAYAKKARYE